MDKNLFITYVLWLFAGWFGLHHIYLGRDRHAFTWWATLGGFFGLGWMREFWRIPDYVAEANLEPQYIQDIERRLVKGKPPFNPTRFAGQLIVGALFGFAMSLALPQHLIEMRYWSWLPYVAVPYSVAIGVHLVGNIGHECGSIVPALIGAFLPLPIYLGYQESGLSYSAIISATIFQWRGCKYSPPGRKRHRNICVRMAILITGSILLSSLWVSFIFHNASLHVANGEGGFEEIRVGEVVSMFLASPEWINLKAAVSRIFYHGSEYGWESLLEELVLSVFERTDPDKAVWAERILTSEWRDYIPGNGMKLTRGGGPGKDPDLVKRCRELMAQYHPDRHRDEKMKREAEKKFIDVKEACDIMLKKGKYRGRRPRDEM